ncbi:hypothetical protein AB1Y20_014819 [Prymnesium parvum]|uniref:J domain-containing protein n=1 Tax=Prymnesium parvum TaxID=97485 RepID=A0AB34JZK1_PRYPA
MRLLQLLRLPAGAAPSEVRARYLEMALALHPDRSSEPAATARFCELQSLWESYRAAHPSSLEEHPPADFTEFGVGCSWTDSSEERARRQELMDQAARGVMNQRRID